MIVWELLMELMFMHLFQFKYKEGFAVERMEKHKMSSLLLPLT